MALQAMNKADWVRYLTNLEIPEQFAEKYAPKFMEHQVPVKFLKFISDEELKDAYGITIGGHRLAIRHGSEPEAQGTMPTRVVARPNVRHQAPQLKVSMTPSSFRSFVSHWTIYKQLVGIPSNGPDSAAQIFSLACTENPEIRRTIEDHRPDHA